MRIWSSRSFLKAFSLYDWLIRSPNQIVKLLVASALVEFVALRVFARVGSIPQVPWVLNAYQTMLTVGSIALSLAFALAILLSLFLVRSLRSGTAEDKALGLSILVMVIAAVTTLVEAPTPIFSVAYSLLAIFVVVSLVARLSIGDSNRTVKLLQVFAALAVVSIFYFKLVPQLEYIAGVSLSSAHSFEVFLAGEAATLLAGVMMSIAFLFCEGGFRVSKKALVWASLFTGGFVFLYITSSWLLSIIVMWTLGYTMFMPFSVYAIALFLFSYTIAASFRSHSWISSGLLLLFFAGRLAQLGYHSILIVLGLGLIALPEHFGFANG